MVSTRSLLGFSAFGFVLSFVHAADAQAPAAPAPAQPAAPPPAQPAAAPPAAVAPAPVPAPAPAPVEPAATPAAPVVQPVVTTTPPAEAPTAAQAPEPETAKEAPVALKDRLKIGGGGILWFYQPTIEDQKNNLEFFNVRLTFDADFGKGFGFHLEPRVRDTKLRSFFAGTAWIQEGYGSYTSGDHVFKLGKIYSLIGLFWDNSFWGNVQAYDGLKLAPDYGASVEGKFAFNPGAGLGYAAQFFLVDGSTNVSLPGRDTISIPDSRRRNQILLRVDPYFKLGTEGEARVGLSGSHLKADSPGIPEDSDDVLRYAVDLKLTYGGAGIWGEYLHQNGQTVTDYPIAGVPATDTEPALPGQASDDIDYFQIGGEYSYDRFTVRYNFSAANYKGVSVKEWLHVPALGFKINDNVQLGAEYVHWSRSIDGAHERYNRSFNLLGYFSF